MQVDRNLVLPNLDEGDDIILLQILVQVECDAALLTVG